jgi:aryl-alcohol dehydrogenase-like predicted oxidoreductase
MKHVNLGGTGLRVSRVCLGMMSFGTSPERPWAVDEDAAEPIVSPRPASHLRLAWRARAY